MSVKRWRLSRESLLQWCKPSDVGGGHARTVSQQGVVFPSSTSAVEVEGTHWTCDTLRPPWFGSVKQSSPCVSFIGPKVVLWIWYIYPFSNWNCALATVATESNKAFFLYNLGWLTPGHLIRRNQAGKMWWQFRLDAESKGSETSGCLCLNKAVCFNFKRRHLFSMQFVGSKWSINRIEKSYFALFTQLPALWRRLQASGLQLKLATVILNFQENHISKSDNEPWMTVKSSFRFRRKWCSNSAGELF